MNSLTFGPDYSLKTGKFTEFVKDGVESLENPKKIGQQQPSTTTTSTMMYPDLIDKDKLLKLLERDPPSSSEEDEDDHHCHHKRINNLRYTPGYKVMPISFVLIASINEILSKEVDTEVEFDDSKLRAHYAAQIHKDKIAAAAGDKTKESMVPSIQEIADNLHLKIKCAEVIGFSNNSPFDWGIQSEFFDADAYENGDFIVASIPTTYGQYVTRFRTILNHAYFTSWTPEKDGLAESFKHIPPELTDESFENYDEIFFSPDTKQYVINTKGIFYELIMKNVHNVMFAKFASILSGPERMLHVPGATETVVAKRFGSEVELTDFKLMVGRERAHIPISTDRLSVHFIRPGRDLDDAVEFEQDPEYNHPFGGDVENIKRLAELQGLVFKVRIDLLVTLKYI